MNNILIGVAAFLFNAVVSAEVVHFETAGLKIGDRITSKFAYDKCPAKDKGNPEITCSKFVNIGSSRVFVMYIFHEHLLAGVTLSFDSGAYRDVVDAYTAKFKSNPHDVKRTKVTTAMGANFINESSIWNTDSGKFTVSKYGSTVKDGFGILETDALAKRQAAEDKKNAIKASGEL